MVLYCNFHYTHFLPKKVTSQWWELCVLRCRRSKWQKEVDSIISILRCYWMSPHLKWSQQYEKVHFICPLRVCSHGEQEVLHPSVHPWALVMSCNTQLTPSAPRGTSTARSDLWQSARSCWAAVRTRGTFCHPHSEAYSMQNHYRFVVIMFFLYQSLKKSAWTEPIKTSLRVWKWVNG